MTIPNWPELFTTTASPVTRVPADAGHEGGFLQSLGADAHGVGLGGHPGIADVDIVAAGGGIKPSVGAQADVVVADSLVVQRTQSHGGVTVAVDIAKKGVQSRGGIESTAGVAGQRGLTDSGVLISGRIVSQRASSRGRVVSADDVVL